MKYSCRNLAYVGKIQRRVRPSPYCHQSCSEVAEQTRLVKLSQVLPNYLMQKPLCFVTPLCLFLSCNARIERQFEAYTHTHRSIVVLVSSHFRLHTTQSLFTGTSAKCSKARYIYIKKAQIVNISTCVVFEQFIKISLHAA